MDVIQKATVCLQPEDQSKQFAELQPAEKRGSYSFVQIVKQKWMIGTDTSD